MIRLGLSFFTPSLYRIVMENMPNMGEKKVCKCSHHKVVPVLVILLGLVFLLQALNIITAGFAMIMWPIVIIAIGVMMIMKNSGMCKCC